MEKRKHIDITTHIKSSVQVKEALLADEAAVGCILSICEECLLAYNRGNKVIFAGNGGSAADSQHLAAEFVSRFRFDRAGLPSLALNTDTSMITAIANDYGYENVFSRQLQANAKSGDVFIGISTSGNSANILKAVLAANELGLATIALTGRDGGKMAGLADIELKVPATDTALIQETHIMIGHIICGFVESSIFDSK